ncbi:solute carrier family 35 member f6 [Anaeramoeba ignava]|uniref:Solute carrier family 35 member f6 n=1 Tax=Anaeramoeba ignava TaxID=1746090 RepID=A0A9Q0LL74_ANAIG|nr:solute carrier family 35 member f6 [Anaeramoeba ignava]
MSNLNFGSIIGLIIFGTVLICIEKSTFQTTSKGVDEKNHLFEKPWFQSDLMFLGLFSLMIFYLTFQRFQKKRGYDGYLNIEKPKPKIYWIILKISFPAICDIIVAVLLNLALLWIPASSWQMLRSSVVIFTSITSLIFLKKKFFFHNLIGILFVMVGLLFVIISIFHSKRYSSDYDERIAIYFIFIAEAISAIQSLYEYHVYHGIKINGIFLTGIQGGISFIICSFIMMPILSHDSGNIEGHGTYENTKDTFKMIHNNTKMIALILIFIFSVIFFNLFSFLMTINFSVRIRTLSEIIRMALVWIINIIIYYGFSYSYGEKWNSSSWFQLIGFIILSIGLLIYQGAFTKYWFWN